MRVSKRDTAWKTYYCECGARIKIAPRNLPIECIWCDRLITKKDFIIIKLGDDEIVN